MKKYPLVLIVLIALTTINAVADVTIYQGTNLYGGNLTVSFTDDVNVRYFEIGDDYFILDSLRINVSCSSSMTINISSFDSNKSLSQDSSVLRFNASYTGSTASFYFTGNNSAAIYSLYKDGVYFHQWEANGFAWNHQSWSEVDFEIEIDGYRPIMNCDTVDAPYNTGNNSLSIDWGSGTNADRYVLVRNNISYPSSNTDGYEVYNDTYLGWHTTNVFSTQYYTLYAWNSTGNTYSTGCQVAWGAIGVNVYNESSPWEQITPFGMLVSNAGGTTTYWNSTCLTTHYLNYTDIPWGTNTIFKINRTGYKTRTYYKNLQVCNFYNFTFYLPRTTVEVPTGPYETNTTPIDTEMYLISVINEVDEAVPDALVIFRRYNNHTSSYVEVGSFLTDGYGQGTIWLIPDTLYKVNITCDGYKDSLGNDYIPNTAIFTKTFTIEFEDVEPQPPAVEPEEITFTATRSETTITIYYNDAMQQTQWTNCTIHSFNSSSETWTFLAYKYTTNTDTWTWEYTGVNEFNDHYVNLSYGHTTFGENTQHRGIIIDKDRYTIITQPEVDNLLDTLLGINPFGWSNTLMFFVLLAGFYFIDKRDAGVLLILLGGIWIFISAFVGFNTAVEAVAGGIIPVLLIVVGIVVAWNNEKKRGIKN